ncbi:MAG TPA: UDP-N-acetylmuramate dehydrogenase, partial [Terriglobales bacterium]
SARPGRTRAILNSMHFEQNVALAPLTTLGVGGPARYFLRAQTESDFIGAIAEARRRSLPMFVLGGGSNLVVSDAGFPGLVLQVALKGIQAEVLGDRTRFSVAGGEDWDEFVAQTVNAGCSGLECLSGIPGTVGASPVQNIGAYGQEVSESIVRVRALSLRTGEFREFSNAECEFSYRHSFFNSREPGQWLITRVDFELARGGQPRLQYPDLKKYFAENASPTLCQVRDAVREIRHRKSMLLVEGDEDARSAGSFFRNPVISREAFARIQGIAAERGITPPSFPAGDSVKVPAAWLIEQSGISKGFAFGNVGISRKHTLAIVNRGGATAADVLALKSLVQERVRDRFGVDLQPEPVFLGF